MKNELLKQGKSNTFFLALLFFDFTIHQSGIFAGLGVLCILTCAYDIKRFNKVIK